MNFAVDNKHFHATIENMEGGKMMRSLLTSNEPIYDSYYNSIFEDLWKNGIDAIQRIREIEDCSSLADLEVCSQPILGLSSRILCQLDNKTAIMESLILSLSLRLIISSVSNILHFLQYHPIASNPRFSLL
jgi:hypothetical protein